MKMRRAALPRLPSLAASWWCRRLNSSSSSSSTSPLRRDSGTRKALGVIRSTQRISFANAGKLSKDRARRKLAEYGNALQRGEQRSELPMSERLRQAHAEMFRQGNVPLFPGTFVSLPLRRYPLSPSPVAALRYHWARLRKALEGSLSLLNLKLKSMPSWTTRPRWKAQRRSIPPTAKAMYRDMLEAFAAGDKTVLRRLCLGDFAEKLCAALDRRDSRREGVRFELVSYNSPLLYPKLLSHMAHALNPLDQTAVTEQAVVAVASTQKLSRYEIATGETIPNTTRVQDKLEYVVLSRQISAKTFESTPWRIWGTTQATTLETYMVDREMLEKAMAKQAGWRETPSK